MLDRGGKMQHSFHHRCTPKNSFICMGLSPPPRKQITSDCELKISPNEFFFSADCVHVSLCNEQTCCVVLYLNILHNIKDIKIIYLILGQYDDSGKFINILYILLRTNWSRGMLTELLNGGKGSFTVIMKQIWSELHFISISVEVVIII